jgi:hypothetical protein
MWEPGASIENEENVKNDILGFQLGFLKNLNPP